MISSGPKDWHKHFEITSPTIHLFRGSFLVPVKASFEYIQVFDYWNKVTDKFEQLNCLISNQLERPIWFQYKKQNAWHVWLSCTKMASFDTIIEILINSN